MIENIKQKGYTLIELLLYISIVGALLTSVTAFYGIAIDARVKNQSISEVEQQGMLAMERIAQTVRNATSISAPATGANGSTLTLIVPTGALSPTTFSLNSAILGYNVDGGTTDTDDNNVINGVKFTASASGTITTLNAYIGPTIAASPNNKGQMAIYNDSGGPSGLLASSGDVTLTANSWNSFPISSVSITNGQSYWLAYNTNGLASGDNALRYHTGTVGQSRFTATAYGTWPSSWTGTAFNQEFSMYASIDTGSGAGAVQITEGAGAAVPLTNDKVVVTALSFKNLSRPSTPGVVQITMTLARVNTANRNEYDYQKTFTTSATLRWP